MVDERGAASEALALARADGEAGDCADVPEAEIEAADGTEKSCGVSQRRASPSPASDAHEPESAEERPPPAASGYARWPSQTSKLFLAMPADACRARKRHPPIHLTPCVPGCMLRLPAIAFMQL